MLQIISNLDTLTRISKMKLETRCLASVQIQEDFRPLPKQLSFLSSGVADLYKQTSSDIADLLQLFFQSVYCGLVYSQLPSVFVSVLSVLVLHTCV